MYITQEADYAMRIVANLAQCGVRKDARSISEEVHVTLRFSLKILGKLSAAGIVTSFKGNKGGYELARAASDITMQDVLSAIDGPYALSRCLSGGECSCAAEDNCAIQRVFEDLSQQINQCLQEVTFESLLKTKS